jgi:hypothetical protein
MVLIESNVKVKSYLRKGKLIKSYSRKDELLAKRQPTSKNKQSKQQYLSTSQKLSIGVASLAAVVGAAYGLKRAGVLDKILSKYSSNGIKPNTKVTSITVRGPASVEEVEKELFGNATRSVKYKGVKVKNTPAFLSTTAFTLMNPDTVKSMSAKLSTFKVTNPKHIKIFDDFVNAPKPKNERFTFDINLTSISLDEVKNRLKASKAFTGKYVVDNDILQGLSKAVSKTRDDKSLSMVFATVNNKDFIKDSLYDTITKELTPKERKLLLNSDALANKYPYLKYESKAPFSISEVISEGYDKANSASSNGLPKKLQSLRVSATRIVGPEGDNARRKYEQALKEYKEKNPNFKLDSSKSSTDSNMSPEKIKYLADLGFTTYNFKGLN